MGDGQTGDYRTGTRRLVEDRAGLAGRKTPGGNGRPREGQARLAGWETAGRAPPAGRRPGRIGRPRDGRAGMVGREKVRRDWLVGRKPDRLWPTGRRHDGSALVCLDWPATPRFVAVLRIATCIDSFALVGIRRADNNYYSSCGHH